MERPHEITARHLARKAVVYVRQSSEAQVRDNRGSTEYQRGLAELAERWGWAPDQVEVIEDDLARSGTAAEHRSGLQRMIAGIQADEVGAVFVGDDSRLSRAAIVTLGILEQCVAKHVLLITDHKVIDVSDPTGHFQASLGAILAEYDNSRRCAHIRRGIEARLAVGKAVSGPPAGYVRGDDGAWDLDPDPAVQTAVRTVYRVFFHERSIPRTVRSLIAQGLELPRRARGGLRWVRPSSGVVRAFLKNRHYTGEYRFRQLVVDRTLGRGPGGKLRLRRAAADEVTVVPEHHPAYLTEAEWAEIQSILRVLAASKARRNLGPGSALLQGLVRCGRHRKWVMSTNYRRARPDGVRPHYYACIGEYRTGGQQCGSVSGLRVDPAVVTAVLQRLAPPRIAAIRQAWQDAQGHQRDAHALERRLLDRLRHEADDLERRYMAVEPSNRLVAAGLERRLEQAKRELLTREATIRKQSAPAANCSAAATLQELEALGQNAVGIFHAPTTTHRDRKEIIRSLVDHVVFESKSAEWIEARVRWVDAARETVLRIPGPLYGRVRILELARGGASVDEIQGRADAEGWVTRRGGQWSEQEIKQALWADRRAK